MWSELSVGKKKSSRELKATARSCCSHVAVTVGVVLGSCCSHVAVTLRVQTSFLDLLPAEVVPAHHGEDGVVALLGDEGHGLLDVVGMQAGRRGLDVADDVHLCQNKKKKKQDIEFQRLTKESCCGVSSD